MNVLTHNWVLKLMALTLAVVLWSHVRGQVNPWEEATFKVPLEAKPPADMVIVNARSLPRTVKVAVRAPRLTLRQLKGVTPANPLAPLEEAPLLRDKSIRAELDFAVVSSGQQKVPVDATTRLDDVQITGVNPDNVAVLLDAADSAEFSVQPQFGGPEKDNFDLTDQY